MEIFVYREGADAVEEGFSPDQLPELLADKTNVVWVDLLGETAEQVEQATDILANIFKFHHLTIEDGLPQATVMTKTRWIDCSIEPPTKSH